MFTNVSVSKNFAYILLAVFIIIVSFWTSDKLDIWMTLSVLMIVMFQSSKNLLINLLKCFLGVFSIIWIAGYLYTKDFVFGPLSSINPLATLYLFDKSQAIVIILMALVTLLKYINLGTKSKNLEDIVLKNPNIIRSAQVAIAVLIVLKLVSFIINPWIVIISIAVLFICPKSKEWHINLYKLRLTLVLVLAALTYYFSLDVVLSSPVILNKMPNPFILTQFIFGSQYYSVINIIKVILYLLVVIGVVWLAMIERLNTSLEFSKEKSISSENKPSSPPSRILLLLNQIDSITLEDEILVTKQGFLIRSLPEKAREILSILESIPENTEIYSEAEKEAESQLNLIIEMLTSEQKKLARDDLDRLKILGHLLKDDSSQINNTAEDSVKI